ncbi:MAG: hypothetical protein QGG40_02760 [Myxococcota bacterium]|nr:hypothetical protein [Myxococcota bacterium]
MARTSVIGLLMLVVLVGGGLLLWGTNGETANDPGAIVAPVAPRSSEELVAHINALNTEVEQVAAVSELLDAPELLSEALCESLAAPTARERCRILVKRPHLWDGKHEAQGLLATDAREAGGPASTRMLPAAESRSLLSGVTPAPGACGSTPVYECQVAAAEEGIRDRDVESVAGACLAVEDRVWSQECFFQSAERWSEVTRGLRYREAVELCMGSGEFRGDCLEHILVATARRVAPRADSAGAEQWGAVGQVVEGVRKTWDTRSPTLGEVPEGMGVLMADRLWSYVLHHAYHRAGVLTGTPLDFVPETVSPHVRSALTAVLYERRESDVDLDGWVAVARGALEGRARTVDAELAETPGPVLDAAIHRGPVWFVDRPGDERIPATWYLGRARRAVSSDVDADLAIGLLHAAVATPPVSTGLLEQGQAHPDPLVRWTADHLAAELSLLAPER